jgi:hypothetical protein
MATKNTPATTEPPSEVVGESDATPPPAPSASVTSIEAITQQHIDEQPEPQPNAISQVNDERAAKAESETDSAGTRFDTAIHTGSKNADGTWRKRPGRKSSAAAGNANQSQSPRAKLSLPGGGQSGTESPDAKVASARASGVGCANLLIALSVGLGGEEWIPRAPPQYPMDEKAALEQGFADYFQSREWEDLPPGLALIACIVVYAMPRLTMPKTKERAKGFKNWITRKIINWKAKREYKKRIKNFGPETDIERADRVSRERYNVERAGLDVAA